MVSAKVEEELAQLEDEERTMFLKRAGAGKRRAGSFGGSQLPLVGADQLFDGRTERGTRLDD